MFERRILQSKATSWSGSNPFKVPCALNLHQKTDAQTQHSGFHVDKTCVPTGMKTGVSTTECGRVISATLALVVEHFASTLNAKAEPSPAPIVTLGVKVKRPDAQGLFADQNSGFGSCPSMLTILDQEELEHLGPRCSS